MRALFILAALAMPMSLMAEEMTDTTVVYNSKQFVISDDSVETRISVYTQDSIQLTKTSETKYVNKQEVERIYVSSPFFPSSTSRFYSSMYPTLWWGTSSLQTEIGTASIENGTSKEGLHAQGGFEIGFTSVEGIFPINKRGNLVLSNAVQVVYSKHRFQNSAMLGNDGHHIAFEDRTNAPASASYMSYGSMRIPFMLGYAPMWPTDWLDMQFGVGIVPQYCFGKASYVFEPEAFGDPIERQLKIYHWGLNVDFNMVLGPVKFSASVGLLPVFKTSEGMNAYCSSYNIGINIGELFGKRSQSVDVLTDQ